MDVGSKSASSKDKVEEGRLVGNGKSMVNQIVTVHNNYELTTVNLGTCGNANEFEETDSEKSVPGGKKSVPVKLITTRKTVMYIQKTPWCVY